MAPKAFVDFVKFKIAFLMYYDLSNIVFIIIDIFNRHVPLTPCGDQITVCIFPAVTVE